MVATVARKRSRPLFATAVAAVLLFVLSGCVKLNADFQVDAEENLSGSMQILIDPVALTDMGSPDPSGELDDAIAEAQSDPEVPDGVIVERAEDEDGFIGMRMTFDHVPASEFAGGSSGLDDVGLEGIEVSSTDGELSFSMANPLVAGMGGSDPSDPFGPGAGMPSSARSMFDEAIVTISFPGNVIIAEGAEISGKTATWDLRQYDGDTLDATGEASSFPWMIVLIAVGVFVVLLVIAGVIILIVVLRRKKSHPNVGSQSGQYGQPGPFQQQFHGSGPYSGQPGGPAAPGQHIMPPSVPPPSGPYGAPVHNGQNHQSLGYQGGQMPHGGQMPPTTRPQQGDQGRQRFAPPPTNSRPQHPPAGTTGPPGVHENP